MSIDRQAVDHVALLARLALTPDERERLRDQLSAILEHINVISEADTSQVPATAHVLSIRTVMVADQVRPSFPREMLLENAPVCEEGYFRVRAVLEED
ncbi:MAG: Asp-tRNA(Asn)/Glu-tRNA(Gln) amidotransferase subunit GatC [Ktedonobacterales bacterium]|nr:Asp-tRNA(Asn)/Glu-tRNA(Gln) amidotransferase subunit GatC [Ktedonobacterales bacterium]